MNEVQLQSAYETYGVWVYRRCLRFLGDRAAAEDTLHDVFLRLWRYSSGFMEAQSKLAWLYRVADNCCLDRIRQQKPMQSAVSLEEFATTHELSSAKALPDEQLSTEQTLVRFFSKLDSPLQMIAIMHFIDACSQEEIAQATGFTRQTVSKKILWLQEKAQQWKECR